jgi:ferredoxin
MTAEDIDTTGANEEFVVEFVDSGITITVPADRTILAVAEESGVPVFYSCQEGICGTCVTPIISGRADHRDSILGEDERQEQSCMCICVSRAEKGCAKLQLGL